MKSWKGSLAISLLPLTLFTLANDSRAVDGWESQAALTVRTVVSDNIHLSDDDKDSDINFRITPSIGLSKDGRYNRVRFNYGLSFQKYLDEAADEDLKHDLTASWHSELYRDLFYLDVNANAGQSLISNSGPGTGDDINTTGNTTQTYTYSISPYIRRSLGSVAELELRFKHDEVIHDNAASRDSSSQMFQLDLSSGRDFQKIGWNIDGSAKRVKRDGSGSDDKYRKIRAEISYALNSNWRPHLYVGYEDNDFTTNTDTPRDSIYGAGVTWTPGPRTTLRLEYGHRFYGRDGSFSLSHRQRRSVLTASFSRDITSSREELLQRQTFVLVDAFGNPVANPALAVGAIALDSPDLSNDIYILDSFRLGYTVQMGRRDTVDLSAHHSRRDNQRTGGEETRWGLGANWSHSFTANLSGKLNLSWETADEGTGSGDDDRWSLGLGVVQKLSERTSFSFDLRHANRDSSTPGSDYSENRATLTLSTSW
ncbi:MAG: TIGR03016 family PEP-CTERM system-associated outer membrane protein [Gammaproteobacteria bacterium]|nr:TIGR03016 family PEP-CTERM system-associated outer membrane protein [Gammaproteobacteria bacterium]